MATERERHLACHGLGAVEGPHPGFRAAHGQCLQRAADEGVRNTLRQSGTRSQRGPSHLSSHISTVTLKLQLGPRYRALARRAGGLRASVTVTFTAHGHPTLRRTLAIRFMRATAHRAARRHHR